MTELVIASILAGSAYIISNRNRNENFVNNTNELIDSSTIEETSEVKNNILPTSLNVKIDEKLETTNDTQYNMNHNNMNHFYKNNSYGDNSKLDYDNILDNYTGSGRQQISKNEEAQLFKPQDNMQNPYGMQNNNDFLMSRVNESNRHANSKPWQEVKEAPGTMAFNSSMEYRNKTMPKDVNELRTKNNPKMNYESNYKGPAYDPKFQENKMGEIIKKTQETYHVNEGMGGMGPAQGFDKPKHKSVQMLTNENRDTTNVSYYGVKGSMEKKSHSKINDIKTNKIQLPSQPVTNLSSQHIFPSSKQNYGKEGFNILDNNRTTSTSYFGNIKSTIENNIVNPIVNELRYTKKNNFVENKHMSKNISGLHKPIVYNPYDKAPTTNREMTSESIGMNHLNVQGQTSDGYIQSNPYLTETQRQTMNNSYVGNAGGLSKDRSYEAEYNQITKEKPYSSRINTGNMSLFNSDINANLNKVSKENNRTNALYAPSNDTPSLNRLGEFTKQTSYYKDDTKIDSTLLEAFKNNPYTHSLNSSV